MCSKELNGGFCKFCALFVVKDRNKLGVLVNKPFKNWVKVTEILGFHATHKNHTFATEAALDFRNSIE